MFQTVEFLKGIVRSIEMQAAEQSVKEDGNDLLGL
jgi:hypothetical protein